MLGNFGVLSAKNGGINVMIVTTILSFIWYQRGNKIPTVSWAKFGNIFMGVFSPSPTSTLSGSPCMAITFRPTSALVCLFLKW